MVNDRGEFVSLIERAVDEGYLSPDEARDARSQIDSLSDDQLSGDMLVQWGHLTKNELSELEEKNSDNGLPELSDLGLADEDTLSIPSTPEIPGYEELELVGRGGMGLVYRAIQTNPRRRVAIKVLTAAHFSGQQKRKRFQREAQAAASLSHPAIPSVYEFGEVDGIPYFAMEYIDGLQLDSYLAEREPDTQQRLRILRDLCEGVGVAHQRGIIHRDLKHANVLVTHTGQVKILDFGLAKLTEKNGGKEVQTLTMEGQVMGTTPYMAPEQTRGEPDAVEARTDVYALGVIMYEAFTGKLPHEPGEDSRNELMERIRTEDVKPPRKLNPDVDRDVEKIIMKCLRKDRPLRYVTATAIAEDLNRYLGNRPILVTPPGPVYRIKKWISRHGLAVASVLVTTVGFVVLTSLGWWTLQQAESRAKTLRERLRKRTNVSYNEANQQAEVGLGLQSATNYYQNHLYGRAAAALARAYDMNSHWLLGYLREKTIQRKPRRVASVSAQSPRAAVWGKGSSVLAVFGDNVRAYRWTDTPGSRFRRLRVPGPSSQPAGSRFNANDSFNAGNSTFLGLGPGNRHLRAFHWNDDELAARDLGNLPTGHRILDATAAGHRYLVVSQGSSGRTEGAMVWTMPASGADRTKVAEIAPAVKLAAVPAGGRQIVVASPQGILSGYDVRGGGSGGMESTRDWEYNLGAVPTSLALSGQSNTCAAATSDGLIYILDSDTGDLHTRFQTPGGITDMDVAEGGTVVSSVHRDEMVRLWTPDTGRGLTAIPLNGDRPRFARFSLDATLLAVAGRENVHIYRWNGGNSGRPAVARHVERFWISPDGTRIAHDGERTEDASEALPRGIRAYALSEALPARTNILGFGPSSERFYVVGTGKSPEGAQDNSLTVIPVSLPDGFRVQDYVPEQGVLCGLRNGMVEIRRVADMQVKANFPAPEDIMQVDMDRSGEFCALLTADHIRAVSLADAGGSPSENWSANLGTLSAKDITYVDWLDAPDHLALGSPAGTRLLYAANDRPRVMFFESSARLAGLISLPDADLCAVLSSAAHLSLFRRHKGMPSQSTRWATGVRCVTPLGEAAACVLRETGHLTVQDISAP